MFNSRILVTSFLAIVFFIVSLFLFTSLIGFENKVRRLSNTLRLLAEFHKEQLEKHNCNNWTEYKNEVNNFKSENSRNLNNLQLYIDYCSDIDDGDKQKADSP